MAVTFLPADMSLQDTYKLLTGLVTPRPIAWVGTRSADGVANLAPFSYFNIASPDPPTVLFCPSTSIVRGEKDSLVNARREGCFTVSMVNMALAEAMNATSLEAPPDIDEFAVAGLTPVAGSVVDAPWVAGAPAAMECRTLDVVTIGRGNVVFGEVMAIHVDPAVLDGTRVRPDVLDAVGRLAGSNYTTTRGIFQMERPRD